MLSVKISFFSFDKSSVGSSVVFFPSIVLVSKSSFFGIIFLKKALILLLVILKDKTMKRIKVVTKRRLVPTEPIRFVRYILQNIPVPPANISNLKK